MFKLDLTCSDTIYTPIELRWQYPKDEHWVLCPICQHEKYRLDSLAVSDRGIPTAWQKVLESNEVDDLRGLDDLHLLRSEPTRIVYGDRIMRLQPSVPPNRIHPFPYKTKRVGFRIS